MSSTQITGGSVKFTEPSNYTSGKTGCEVTIHFTVGEGDGQMASVMGDTAYCEAMRLATGKLSLGGPLAAMRSAPMPETPWAMPAQPAPAATAAPTGDTLVGAASTGMPAPGVIGTSTGPIATTAASPSEAVVIGYPPTQTAAPAATSTIGVITLQEQNAGVGNGHDAGISDLDLRGAVERKLAQFDPGKDADAISRQRGPIAVAQLLAQYVTPPAKVYALAPEQRPEFMAKLAALTLS